MSLITAPDVPCMRGPVMNYTLPGPIVAADFVSPLMTLLALVSGNAAQQFGNCDYIQEMEPGKQYYVFNTNYPQQYRPGSACRWIAKSDGPIRLTCDPFTLPGTEKCSLDAVVIKDASDSIGHRYCGNGTLNLVSESDELSITFTSSANSPGGKFLCTLETVATNEDTDCRCGWKNPSRIVGGEETGVNEYPMMAGLVDATQRLLFCGATIINEKQVLTAAHCVDNRNPVDIGVLVGDHDLSTGSETNATKLFRVDSFNIHPQHNDVNEDYDAAIVTIRGTITFSQQVGPVCLPFQHYPDTFAGNFVNVLGWGSTEFAGPVSNVLQKVKLSVVTNQECRRTHRGLTTRQLCTFAEGRDSCQFDSGGPVLWQNPTTRRIVEVGLVSSGGVCADGEPAVNSRVGAFVDWITENTPRGITYCKLE